MTHIDLHDSLTNKTGNSHSIDVDAYHIHVMKFLILIYMPIKLCRGLIILGQMIKILKMINVLMENDIET